jgi:Rab3 GTPase-activating protein catalytic subunit
MQAFKAANPGCILADFVRWYSPRDWLVDGEHDESNADGGGDAIASYPYAKGLLSGRMRKAGNLWQSTWQQAEAIPSTKQPPLVRYEKEGAKVIDYLATLSPVDMMEQYETHKARRDNASNHMLPMLIALQL